MEHEEPLAMPLTKNVNSLSENLKDQRYMLVAFFYFLQKFYSFSLCILEMHYLPNYKNQALPLSSLHLQLLLLLRQSIYYNWGRKEHLLELLEKGKNVIIVRLVKLQ